MEREIDRLDKYLKHKGISDYSFSKNTGNSDGFLRGSRKTSSSLTDKTREKIFAAYPDLNKIWLLTGEGDMFNGEAPPTKDPVALSRKEKEELLQQEVNELKEQLKRANKVIEHLISKSENKNKK